MQLTSLLTALLGVSTTALALPTADTIEAPTTYTADESLFNNTTPLEKRAHYGWLSSYAPNDKECKGGWGGDRPRVDGNGCITFKPVSHNIGIYHGSWPLSFGSLDVFIDANCRSKMGTIAPPADGDRQCVDRNKISIFNWGSVKPA